MWIADESRLQQEYDKKPGSSMWIMAANISVCHQNYCRKTGIVPIITTDQVYEWIDETEPAEVFRVSKIITDEIATLNGSSGTDQPATEAEKKIAGETPVALSSVS